MFVPTVIGYIAWPDALYARGLAVALVERGHDMRVVEKRRNRYFTETLQQAGSEPARRFFDDFPQIQHHTYEARSGMRLFEWVTREIALLDVAVVVVGIDSELEGLLGAIDHPGLTRLYVAFHSSDVDTEPPSVPDIARFDAVLTPVNIPGLATWQSLPLTVAPKDREYLRASLDGLIPSESNVVADAFERAVKAVRGAG